jgi:D-glycero-alpha-D-manno-heptose-7-phosphate kinase
MAGSRRRGANPLVQVVVPNRVDLAGGTLDIFPIYLLVPGAMTVNAAICVASVVSVHPVRGGAARLVSDHFSRRAEALDTHCFSTRGAFGLVARALRHFPPQTGIELRFRNEAPVGSGIGASSALLVATMLAMGCHLGKRRRWREVAREAMEIEAAHLRNLTGSQDHIAALRGGIQGIRYLPGRMEAERIAPKSPAGRKLAAHGFLASTGKSHFSAGLNWRMIRGAIDGHPEVLRKFRNIARAAREAWEALSAGETDGVGRAVAREWAIRRTIARGISLHAVDELFSSTEFRRRVSGAKLCGAGGGGMVFGLLREPGDRGAMEEVLKRRGFSPFPFRISDGPRMARAGGILGR